MRRMLIGLHERHAPPGAPQRGDTVQRCAREALHLVRRRRMAGFKPTGSTRRQAAWPIAAYREHQIKMVSLVRTSSSLEVIYRVDDRHCAPHIRAATDVAITFGSLPSADPVPYSKDSDNVEREIEP